jgi:hypothetical protein
MSKVNLVFKPIRFISIILFTHLIIFLLWSFVEMSFVIPLIKTFSTNCSRFEYIIFLICLLIFSGPFYLPFEESEI